MIEMLPVVELIRLEENDRYGTFGIIKINKQVFSVCLEPSDLLNTPFKGSIPAQQYFCKKHYSPRFHHTYKVLDVPERSDVLFHPLNIVEETAGCIGLAQYWGKLRGDRAVLNSGATFRKFMDIMEPYERFHLTITSNY